MAHEPTRLFTLAEALAQLDELRGLVRAMQRAQQAILDARDRLAELSPAVRGNGHAQEAEALERTLGERVAELRELLSELQTRGVELKDIARGLLDFPSLRDGRVVYLCWKIDEPTIAYWHELDAGFAGRQLL
jgi:hypothetical protein